MKNDQPTETTERHEQSAHNEREQLERGPLEREQIEREMTETRARTLQLFRLVRDESDLHESPGFGFRPIIWHLAHIGVFEAYWLLQKLRGEPAPDERYERIFDPIRTPREESKNLPRRGEMEDYLSRVRERAWRSLAETDFDSADPLLRRGYVFHLVLEHERQHQETLAYLFQLLDPSKKTPPSAPERATIAAPVVARQNVESVGGMALVPAGSFQMGSVWDDFAYDNELPAGEVFVPAFKLDRLLTTNEEYARFVAEGGYERREWWSEEGWTWRERENWECPLYWRRDASAEKGARAASDARAGSGASVRSGARAGLWRVRGMFGEEALDPRRPVAGVSWYEAEAYARFAGKRLPTEAEWEKAASWDAGRGRKRRFAWGDAPPSPDLCNFGSRFWQTTAVGSFPSVASPYGCLDMTGNVWEWTADAFQGFPGFKFFPYPEYSETWFDGDHRVLKGGSWATSASVLRTSFRNFFRRHFRIAFAGIRLAADA